VVRLRYHTPLLSCLLLGAVSCAPDTGDFVFEITYDPCQVIVIAPDPDASDDELASIDDAIDMWNSTGATHLTRIEYPHAPRLQVLFDEASPAFYGIYVHQEGHVFINRMLKNRYARAVTVAHELGHAFGMLHVAGGTRTSVMNKGNLRTPPQASDAEALVELWGRCPELPWHATDE
jgi:hypothetical protein